MEEGVAHLAQIGGLAAREVRELGKTFRFRPAATPQVACQSASRTTLEAAMRLGAEGRMRHTAATRELEALRK